MNAVIVNFMTEENVRGIHLYDKDMAGILVSMFSIGVGNLNQKKTKMKAEWYVEFRPDNGMGVIPRDTGPFPYEEWARGWAFIEMKNFPLSWWSIKNRKAPPKPKAPRVTRTKEKLKRLIKHRADSQRVPW